MIGKTPVLNLAAIKRKQKGLTKEFGGIVIPYYKLDTEGMEGQPVKLDDTKADTVKLLAVGEGHLCLGLLAQNVIDDSTYGQLQGYHFANDTRARPGDAVGVLSGAGYAKTLNYKGTVARGKQVYFDPTDLKFVDEVTEGNALPIVFDEDADAGANENYWDSTSYQKQVRIRFNFNAAIAATIGS